MPLRVDFHVRMHIDYMRINQVEAMYGRSIAPARKRKSRTLLNFYLHGQLSIMAFILITPQWMSTLSLSLN